MGNSEGDQIGRPVRVVSMGIGRGRNLEEVGALVETEGAKGADLIALPEYFMGHVPEPLEGATVPFMAELAKKFNTYLLVPIHRVDGEKCYNSAVLIDRNGDVVHIYNKLFVAAYAEMDPYDPPISPGEKASVYETDFGRLGLTICFDGLFPEVWNKLAEEDAEMVLWTSEYSAGICLQAHAINHHYYIVTVNGMPFPQTDTHTKDCTVIDITGEEIFHEEDMEMNISRVTIDLDRGLFHADHNLEKRDKLLAERGDDVEMERWWDREKWFILKAKRPGVLARELAREYGLMEMRDYINRSRREVNEIRGWDFR